MDQVVFGAAVPVAQPVQRAMDGGRGHDPAPTRQRVRQIGHDPRRDRIALVERTAREQLGEGLVGGGVQLAGSPAPRPVSEAVAPRGEQAIAPGADVAIGRVDQAGGGSQGKPVGDQQEGIGPMADAGIGIRTRQLEQGCGVGGEIRTREHGGTPFAPRVHPITTSANPPSTRL